MLGSFSNNTKGIFYAVLAALFGALLVVLVRYLAQDFHVFFIVMVRNFLALILLMPIIIRKRQNIFKTKKFGLHLFRSINGLISMFVWFYVVTIMPLSEAVSISFVVPILSSVVAVYYLKEVVKKEIFLACILGFIGVLIVLRPGFREFSSIYLFSLASLFLWTISNVAMKLMSRTESPETIVVYMTALMLVMSIPFGLFYLEPLGLRDVALLLALGLVSNLLHFSISHSYKLVDLSYVQPFDFMRLVFTAVLAYFIFGEVIDFWVVIGSIVILFGVILVLPKRKKKKKELEAVVPEEL